MLHQDPFDFCSKNPQLGEFLFGNLAGLEVPDNSRPLGIDFGVVNKNKHLEKVDNSGDQKVIFSRCFML